MIRRLWRVARSGVDPEPEREVVAAVESQAFLEALERHDRLRLEAQRVTAEEADGVVNAERSPEGRDPRLDEPTDHGYEAKDRHTDEGARRPGVSRYPRGG
jgi:hypothetical protein